MNYARVVLDGLWWLWRDVDEYRKNASILAILVGRRRRLPLDGSVPALCPIWLIVTLMSRSLEVFKVVGWTIYVVVAV
jgi:hypothetical protein